MAYTINLTNGSTFAVIPDGTVNTASSVTLIGKNYAGYGQFLDTNFIQMIENFASPSLAGNPTASKLAAPLVGQLWWDSTNGLMKVWAGSTWKIMTGSTSGTAQPSTNVVIGDLWYDTTNAQLKVYNGSSFSVVGPAYSSSQGTTGAIPLSINDNGGTPHLVTAIYTNNTLVAIVSPDSTFIPQSPYATAFPKIYKGVTVYNSGVLSGNIANPGNVVITSNNNDTLIVTSTGANISGTVSASGNITAGNVLTGIVSASGNLAAANVNTGIVSASGNVVAGNVNTAIVSASGNVTVGNLAFGTGQVSGTGNITAGNILYGAGVISGTGNIFSRTLAATGNVSVGNLAFGSGSVTGSGIISTSGNVTGAYFFGNGSQLTGLSAAVSVSKIENGTSNVQIAASGGNVSFNVAGSPNVVVVSSTVMAVSNISVANNISTTGNATGNIGSAANPFNTVFAKATTAQYADLAERFAADDVYDAGTVVELGGEKEITKVRIDLSENVFGVISTRAAYLMNGAAGDDTTHPPVAMTGRVPVRVVGTVNKGDRLVSAGDGLARAARPGEATSFNVIGRALSSKTTPEEGTIEAIVTIK